MSETKLGPPVGLTEDAGEPELRLWRSVVMQAICDSMDVLYRQEIMEWILDEDFETVCALADLSPDKLGRRLTEVLMAHRPRAIVLANCLKSDVERGALAVC